MTALLKARRPTPPNTGFEMHDTRVSPPPDERNRQESATAAAPRRAAGERYASLLRDYQAAIDIRAARERQLGAEQTDSQDQRERELRERLADRSAAHAADVAALDAEIEQRRTAALAELEAVAAAARDEHLARVREIESAFYRETSDVEARYQDSSWVTSSVLDDSADDSPLRQFERATQTRDRSREAQVAELGGVEDNYRVAAGERGWRERSLPEPDLRPRTLDEAQQQFTSTMEAARAGLASLGKLKLPRLFQSPVWLIVLLAIVAAVFTPVFLFVNPALVGVAAGSTWGVVSAGAAAFMGLLVLLILYMIGSTQQTDRFYHVQEALIAANVLHQRWLVLADREQQKQQSAFDSQQAAFVARRQESLDRYQRALDEHRHESERTRTQDLLEENTRFGELQQAVDARHAELTGQIASEFGSRRANLIAAADFEQRELVSQLDEHLQLRRRHQAELWHQLKTEWEAATRQLDAALQQAQADSAAQFADWANLADGNWSPPSTLPLGFRRGEYQIDLEQWAHAIPADMRLAPRTTHLRVPSETAFPEFASLFLRTSGPESRAGATHLLQSLLLRWLTLVPPGKLRLTIIDPVGLGESFAGFMHLADYDELLVTKRIWTEPDQIEQQLADLTQHMENVLQKYLRNEFASIEEYNTFAGEVAEPYRVLVITDFPAKFSELAARRLTSIIASGPRCGVFTLLSMDPKRDLPHGFDPAVLEENLPELHWTRHAEKAATTDDLLSDGEEKPAQAAAVIPDSGPGFRVTSGPLAHWPLTIDAPPPPEQFTAIVRRVGDASKDARRVEVSFDRIAPPADQLWTLSSRQGIDIPLGRAGATKHQHLRLGKGTSQHMLIAGKTGSGKSTFLHCLITNLALYYSPDEVRFSLVDFKKGVEFKAYAALQLPHADVIAIESDREFGVSVLQRLDGVLQERGDLFRRQGVQDLAGFRAAQPTVPLPRLLLVIDEFQEFFVEEDRLGQSAALLLDRLIRQGRAFGMHVVLGSQTLGGAYSLARSTMGQVAVRVALQCSEADAHLILSEENTAARLLTRPGEAIYNDANGLVEGNHPFQIAWLPDDQRETWLRRLQALAAQRGRHDPPAIVFEGNIPSDPAWNTPLVQMLQRAVIGAAPHTTPSSPQVWLGEAVEIKPPTALTFERRNGANVLIVGQDADAALGIMTTAAVTLAAQLQSQPDRPPVVVLDGSAPNSPEGTAWQSLALRFPEAVSVVGPRGAGEALQNLNEDLQRRLADPDGEHPPRFLLVHHLSRFRDLRKGDDDFGMSSFGGGGEKPVEPSKLFSDLLAGGPAVGLHTLVWCDSANTVERWFSRTSMRELENRIVFQMNSTDSSNLVDSPAAARLGVHRALLYREESGTSEKFRPYHAPGDDWLKTPSSPPPNPSAHEGAGHPDSSLARDLSEFRIL